MDVMSTIFEEIMKDYTKKYKEYKTLEEYLNSFTKKKLFLEAVARTLVEKEEGLKEVIAINKEGKKEIINYIINNIEDIIYFKLLALPDDNIKYLKEIVNNNNELVVVDHFLPIDLITNLGNSILLHVYYDKKIDTITLNIQKDISKVINKVISSKKFIKEHNNLNNFEKEIDNLMEVYGIIDVDNLYKVYIEVYKKITITEFKKNLYQLTIKDSPITEKIVNDKEYITILSYDNDKDIELILNSEEEYKVYDKDFYEKLYNREYLKNLKSYENLYDYFLKYYDLDLNEEEDVFEMIVCDYLYQIQEGKDRARNAIYKGLENYFDINSKQKNEIINYLNRIYYDYPKWRKKGNI